MVEFEYLYQLTAINVSGPPIKDTFIYVGLRPDGETYKINPSLLNLLQRRQFTGDGKEQPYQHVQFFMRYAGHLNLMLSPMIKWN